MTYRQYWEIFEHVFLTNEVQVSILVKIKLVKFDQIKYMYLYNNFLT